MFFLVRLDLIDNQTNNCLSDNLKYDLGFFNNSKLLCLRVLLLDIKYKLIMRFNVANSKHTVPLSDNEVGILVQLSSNKVYEMNFGSLSNFYSFMITKYVTTTV